MCAKTSRILYGCNRFLQIAGSKPGFFVRKMSRKRALASLYRQDAAPHVSGGFFAVFAAVFWILRAGRQAALPLSTGSCFHLPKAVAYGRGVRPARTHGLAWRVRIASHFSFLVPISINYRNLYPMHFLSCLCILPPASGSASPASGPASLVFLAQCQFYRRGRSYSFVLHHIGKAWFAPSFYRSKHLSITTGH